MLSKKMGKAIFGGFTLFSIVIGTVGVWMILSAPESGSLNNVTAQDETYSFSDVASKDNRNECWTIFEGKVYDITDFISNHPGGPNILEACGIDSTDLFNSQRHSKTARAMFEPFYLGTLQ